MIENRVESRESLNEIGTVAHLGEDFSQPYVLYDIFDNDEEFVEIWVPWKKITMSSYD